MKNYKTILKIAVGVLTTAGITYNYFKTKKLEEKSERSFLLQAEVNQGLLNEVMGNREEIISLYEHMEALCQFNDDCED